MKILVLYCILYIPVAVYAQETTSTAIDKAVVCSSCHGKTGNSDNPQWPNLAGQHPQYFIKQLKDMQDSAVRNAPAMNALVGILSEQDIHDLAIYYAKMPLAKGISAKEYLARGKQIYRGGDFGKRISACIACHGPNGTGNPQAGFPVLSGQHADYTVQQLLAFKKGIRKNDLNHIMQDISSRMSRKDMQAVAQYIEGLN